MSELVWPSAGWLAHGSACPRPRHCPHPVQFPDWWLAMSYRGIPHHPDRDRALHAAVQRINTFQGHPPLSPDGAMFVQQAVIDALVVAPQPVTRGWVSASLSAVGQLVRWAENTGQRLDRQRLLSDESRDRFIHVECRTLTKGARTTYQSRLDLIASVLLSQPRSTPRVPIPAAGPLRPLTLTDEADLWAWSHGIRPKGRRQRVQAMLVLGLGVGVTRAEKVLLRPEDVTDHGDDGVAVDVTDPHTGEVRTVWCLAGWERRLREIAAATPDGHLLVAPWTTRPGVPRAHDQALWTACLRQPPPVEFNNVTLRTTWLCRHLEAGTPLKVLMAAANIATAERLVQLTLLMPDVSEGDRARWLRGVR